MGFSLNPLSPPECPALTLPLCRAGVFGFEGTGILYQATNACTSFLISMSSCEQESPIYFAAQPKPPSALPKNRPPYGADAALLPKGPLLQKSNFCSNSPVAHSIPAVNLSILSHCQRAGGGLFGTSLLGINFESYTRHCPTPPLSPPAVSVALEAFPPRTANTPGQQVSVSSLSTPAPMWRLPNVGLRR